MYHSTSHKRPPPSTTQRHRETQGKKEARRRSTPHPHHAVSERELDWNDLSSSHMPDHRHKSPTAGGASINPRSDEYTHTRAPMNLDTGVVKNARRYRRWCSQRLPWRTLAPHRARYASLPSRRRGTLPAACAARAAGHTVVIQSTGAHATEVTVFPAVVFASIRLRQRSKRSRRPI